MNPFKELLFLQGYVTQAALLKDPEVAPELPSRQEAPRRLPAGTLARGVVADASTAVGQAPLLAKGVRGS